MQNPLRSIQQIFTQQSNSSFLFILITAFLSVMGIGLVIPVIPFIVIKYVSNSHPHTVAFYVGLLISSYAFCQFFGAPVLGALSDRFGRRPVLLLCQLGSVIGYLLFGLGGSLWVLFLGRIIDGITGGDISTIFAYVADITEPRERGKSFGLIGAVIGLGFILGPTIGGIASNISLTAPFFLAAGVTILNMLFGFFVLPESLDPQQRSNNFTLKHLNPFVQLQFALKKPTLRILLLAGLFYFLPFAVLQGINAVFLKDTLHFTPFIIGLLFLLIGLFDIITQGFLSGKLLPKFGEKRLMTAGLFFTGLFYLLSSFLTLVPSVYLVIFGTIIYSFGSGLWEPAFNALVSHSSAPQEQGRVQGANQSVQSLTRIVGPLLAAGLYQIHWGLPYLSCAVLSLIGIWIVVSLIKPVTRTDVEYKNG